MPVDKIHTNFRNTSLEPSLTNTQKSLFLTKTVIDNSTNRQEANESLVVGLSRKHLPDVLRQYVFGSYIKDSCYPRKHIDYIYTHYPHNNIKQKSVLGSWGLYCLDVLGSWVSNVYVISENTLGKKPLVENFKFFWFYDGVDICMPPKPKQGYKINYAYLGNKEEN